ncbi:rod shape-determining protein RodA [Polluticoccus soli]|uniref:rod shape-determining protein RodA n=1 Tax=Polluticoccus soli TaxID=3034150 RepID=UPI0023E3318A|nr:rod shape-determining protein RodA [Flavipsychrobacter sp. JY13-12]
MTENQGKSVFSRLDGITVLLYLALVTIGLLTVFSVEYRSTDPSIFMMNKSHMRQFTWLGISLFVGLLIVWTDTKFFSSFAYLSYTMGLFLLVLTIFAGVDVKGSHSWLGVGSVRFQPGEVCKIFTSLALAKFLSSPETNFKTLKHRLIGAAIALVPAVLIILQQETGLALVYFCFFLVMYREGLPNAILILAFSIIILTLATLLVDRTTLFIVLTVMAIIAGWLMRRDLKKYGIARIIFIAAFGICVVFSQFAVPFIFKNVLQKHQIERIYSTLGQEVPTEYMKVAEGEEPTGKKVNTSEYNVIQSKIAIGSGGFWGKGFLNGTSTKNEFVPEQNTDFIFCAVGEQFGFVGSAILIMIYVSLMLRILYLAERQRSAFSRIYGYCVASILFFHFAINISMTIGLAPVIGITLPFLSYGGSSLLSFSILVCILLRLDSDRSVMIR